MRDDSMIIIGDTTMNMNCEASLAPARHGKWESSLLAGHSPWSRCAMICHFCAASAAVPYMQLTLTLHSATCAAEQPRVNTAFVNEVVASG